MKKHWRDCRLGDVLTLKRGHDLPGDTRIEGDVPVVSSSGITGFHNEAKAQAPGVVTGRYGTIGEVFYLDQDYWPLNTSLYVIDFKGTRPRFAAYFLRNILKDYQSDKAAVPGVDRNVLHEIKVRAPDPTIQERIEATLTAYDDLMENNRRRMALLEESARLLYREWFVHLRYPERMKDEGGRMNNGVPQGWAVKPLQEVAEFRLGKMLDEKKNRGEPLPYLANVNLRWGEFDLTNLREMRFEEHELETFGLKFGDIVMCEGGEPGRCAIWKDQMPGMMFQKAIHRIRCRENMGAEYLYQNLRHQAESGHFATLFTGATIKHFPREKLAKVTVVVPPKRLLDLFTSFARPVETQLAHLEAANRRAKEARDLLLPRLMSGEIEV